MKSYCDNCKANKKSSFRDSGNFEDLCCDTCHGVIASIQERHIQFIDKNKRVLFDNDVLKKGGAYYRFCANEEGDAYLLSCQGYTHNLNAELLSNFEYFGTFEGNKDLFNCKGEVEEQDKVK